MMSPPQSQTKSVLENQLLQYQNNSATAKNNINNAADNQSLDGSIRSAKHRTGAPFAVNNMNMMVLADEASVPQVEPAVSQKQFNPQHQHLQQQRVTSGPYKRTNSKGPGGQGHLKAYLPKLTKTATASANARMGAASAKGDGKTPTGTNAVSMGQQYRQMGGSGGSGNPRQRKFGKISRSQHGSNSQYGGGNSIGGHNSSTQITAQQQQQRLLAMQQQQQQRGLNSGSDCFIPTDLSNQIASERNPMESTSRSLIIVDDYQRQAIGLSTQEAAAQSAHASNGHLHVRKQRSQLRGGQGSQNPSSQYQHQLQQEQLQSQIAASNGGVKRRNSQANNRDSVGQVNGRGSMLPPIFSGPQKKNSSKAKALVPLHPNSKKQQVQQHPQYRSQFSDCSPMDQQHQKYMSASEKQNYPQMEEPGSGLLVNYPQQQDNDGFEFAEEQQLQPKKAVNFVKKNEERLRQMQEQRAQELKNIEEQRSKLLRRQEKLKQNVLRDAQAYKAVKAQRAAEQQQNQAEEDTATNGIKLSNIKNRGSNLPGQTSPLRSNQTTTKTAFGTGISSPRVGTEGASGVNNSLINSAIDEEKTEEEKAEEKKKFDMMRKFYRNRHSSFLQALAEQKAKKELEEKAMLDKQEKKKQKIKQKVVGDGSQIRSKLYEPRAIRDEQADSQLQEVPTPLAGLNPKQLNSTSKSSTTAASNKKRVQRGNSVSSLSQADKAYNDSTTVATSSGNKVQRQGQGSRGSSRAASSRDTPKERNIIAANRSATSLTRNARVSAQNQNQQMIMTAEEQLEFDEKREQEILKEAAERKARAQAIRDRQEKQLAAIREKVAKEKEDAQKKENRQKKLQDQAREAVVQRAEEIKNMPSLREQQDSRMKKHRDGEEGGKQPVNSQSPGKPAAKPIVQDTESFNNFLERNKTYIKTVQLNITDMKEWKKKNRVDADTKVFIIKGGYGDVKRALKQRGWVENKEKDSPCYDFLWTLMTKDVQHNNLLPNQIVNHFPTATSITTKVGLTHSLKNLIWFNSVDIDTFYPRCYDLAIKEELDDFIQEFKQVKAVSYIKIYVREMREAFEKSGNSMTEEIKSTTVTDKIYKVAMKVCKQRTRELDDLIDDPNGFESLVTDREWAVLSTDEHTEESLAAIKHERWLKKQQEQEAKIAMGKAPKVTKKKQKEARDQAKATREASKAKAAQALRQKEQDNDDEDDDDEDDDEDYDYDQEYDDEDGADDEKEKPSKNKGAGAEDAASDGAAEEGHDDEYDDEYGDYGDEDNAVIAEDKPQKVTSKKASASKATSNNNLASAEAAGNQDGTEEEEEEAEDVYAKPAAFAQPKLSQKQKEADAKLSQRYPKFAEAIKVLDLLREKYPQINLDGERNIWIMKPAGSSRGRGICLKRDLCEILDLIKFKDSNQLISNQKNGQLYICQKYIENSLIMKCRKFDIRQWVLVTDWNPLTIWIYAEPYIRFPAADFDFNKISNRYAHLSNNSIAKYGTKVTVTHKIEGNMWDLEQFQNYLQQTYGFDVWEDKIVDGIKNIVINSLESVQDNFESKKGMPFEMFGYDIMVDDDFNCWLIEVNSSPAMDYSTDVTERLVKMVLEDTVKVVIDYGLASAKKQKKVDTGGFECVYKAKRIVEKPLNSFGLNMEVHGRKIPKHHLKKY